MVEKPASQADVGGEVEAHKERKGLWSPEEDERLYTRITRHGVSTWSSVAQLAGLRRSGKSCRLRWMNYLRPDLKKEPISKREEETIISLQKSLGNRWSVIAAKMPGRTDNEIKNYWNSRIRKRQNASPAGGKGDSGCAKQQGDLPAADDKASVLAGPRAKEPVSSMASGATAPPVPARFPLFACQLLGGGGGTAAIAAAGTTESTTTHENNRAGSESDASVGNGSGGGGDGREGHYYYCAVDGDIDMIHLMSFDDLLEYPASDLLMDAWDQNGLYSTNTGNSVD
ncbi:myb-related protein Hv33-like [Triticum dicoccoides]|uniref:myb-related protein Hv33-like n=1 Tax=Triticum dicoccoides TaxID=85692 RepID=UPI00188FDF05|nr:myb-related protein Hv33-like [Triticum dicoccoides]